MSKSPDAFRTISEVADWLGVQAHVLRFWESKFAQVKPVKRAGGRRYYRPADMLLLGGIKKLLHEDGLTIKGAQKLIREQGVTEVSSFSQPLEAGPSETYEAEPAGDAVVRFTGRPGDQVEVPETRPAPKPERFATSLDLGPDPQPAADPAPAEERPDEKPAARLPSFMHRAAPPEAEPPAPAEPETSPVADEPAMAAEPEAGPRARVVDAPDPPPEEEIAATPGLLSRTSRVTAVGPDLAREMAPVLADLTSWLGRRGQSAAG